MSITILLRCKDMAETRRFYRDVLGFPVRESAEDILTADILGGTLIFTESDLWKLAPAFSGTIYFSVRDLDALYAEMSARIQTAWGPEAMPYGSREFAVVDCNGYYIAFRQAI